MKYFSIKQLHQHTQKIDSYYHEYIIECINFIENDFPSTILQEVISDQILTILHTEKQCALSSLRLYWFQKLQDLLYVGELLYSFNSSSSENETKQFKNDINIFWETNNFLPVYTKSMVEKGNEKKFNEWLGLLEQQIISFYYLHINSQIPLPFPTLYFPVYELGESNMQIRPKLQQQVIIPENTNLPLIVDHITDTTLHTKEPTTEFSLSSLPPSPILKKVQLLIDKLPSLQTLLPLDIKDIFFNSTADFLPGLHLPQENINLDMLIRSTLFFSLQILDLLMEEDVISADPSKLDNSLNKLTKEIKRLEEKNSTLNFSDILPD